MREEDREEEEVRSKVPNWPLYLGMFLAAAVVLLNLLNPMVRQEISPPPEPFEWHDPLDNTLSRLEADMDAELTANDPEAL